MSAPTSTKSPLLKNMFERRKEKQGVTKTAFIAAKFPELLDYITINTQKGEKEKKVEGRKEGEKVKKRKKKKEGWREVKEGKKKERKEEREKGQKEKGKRGRGKKEKELKH